jgi:hypothetical protein
MSFRGIIVIGAVAVAVLLAMMEIARLAWKF